MNSFTPALGISSGATMATFNALCRVVGSRRRGHTLRSIGDAHPLAQELHSDTPDPVRVEFLARRLGLGPGELASVGPERTP